MSSRVVETRYYVRTGQFASSFLSAYSQARTKDSYPQARPTDARRSAALAV